jgi:hypothetical protein
MCGVQQVSLYIKLRKEIGVRFRIAEIFLKEMCYVLIHNYLKVKNCKWESNDSVRVSMV